MSLKLDGKKAKMRSSSEVNVETDRQVDGQTGCWNHSTDRQQVSGGQPTGQLIGSHTGKSGNRQI